MNAPGCGCGCCCCQSSLSTSSFPCSHKLPLAMKARPQYLHPITLKNSLKLLTKIHILMKCIQQNLFWKHQCQRETPKEDKILWIVLCSKHTMFEQRSNQFGVHGSLHLLCFLNVIKSFIMKFSMRACTAHNYIVIYTPI